MMNQKSRKEGCESYASERRVASRDESYEKHYPLERGPFIKHERLAFVTTVTQMELIIS